MLLKVFETLSLQVQASPAGAQKHEKQIEEDTKSNNGASSVLRPRAVLSSPDNDGMIGHINRLSRVLPSVTKKKDLGEKTCVPSKVNPRCVKAKSPVNTRRDPDLTAPKQKSGPRKVKANS
ncbi:hypothetical protein MKW92_031502 [Papaver armeniacum]|nr:hypothetical protein MKW92_031502 [Papaver armeniacum]